LEVLPVMNAANCLMELAQMVDGRGHDDQEAEQPTAAAA
jgi:hypothetical protein